jgi:hypothetical protein
MSLFYVAPFARPVDPVHAMPANLVLYQRDDCPLCDQALALLAQARAPEFDSVWIDGDDALEARYGARVPVLRNDARGAELEWPFTVETLRVFLAGGDTAL